MQNTANVTVTAKKAVAGLKVDEATATDGVTIGSFVASYPIEKLPNVIGSVTASVAKISLVFSAAAAPSTTTSSGLGRSTASANDDRRPLPVAGLTERLQAICPSFDGPPRDVYRLPGIEPLELLLAIPHRIAAGPTEAWVRRDASGLFEPP